MTKRIALIVGVMLAMPPHASQAAAAVRVSPETLWKAGPSLEPLIEKGRPWALMEKPSEESLSDTLEHLQQKASLMESDMAAFVETAAEADKEIASYESGAKNAGQKRFMVEYLLKFLADAIPTESERAKQISDSLAVLLSLQLKSPLSQKVSQPIRSLSDQTLRLQAQAKTLPLKLGALRLRVLSSALGSRSVWLANQLDDSSRDLEWQIAHIKENANQLREKTRL